MRFRTTCLLLLILAVLGGAIVVATQKNGGSSESDESNGLFVVSNDRLNWSGLKRVQLQNDGQQFTFEREGSDWRQTEPANFLLQRSSAPTANQQQNKSFRDLIAGLQASVVQGTQPADASLDRLGLGNNTAPTLTLEDNSEHSIQVRIGTVRLGTGYVMLDEQDEVIRTGDAFQDFLNHQPFHAFRIQTLSPAAIHRSKSISITRPDGQHQLTKQAGLWRFTDTNSGLCDRQLIQQAMDAISKTTILAYVDDAPAPGRLSDFGLGDGSGPAATVIFQTPVDEGQGTITKPCTLRLGRPANAEATAYLATWSVLGEESRAVIALAAETVAPWLAPIDVLRLQRMTSESSTDLTKIQINDTTLTQTPDGWQKDDNTPVSQAQTESLQWLLQTQAIDLAEDKTPSKTSYDIVFHSLTRAEPGRVTLWHDGQHGWFIRDNEPVQMQLQDEAWDALQPLLQ